MVDTISENKYIRYKMDKMPNERAGATTHDLKKGESLWGLAQAALGGKGKATNAQISDYMLRIAKLNGLDTIEKMNSLKAGTKIYMPGQAETVAKPSQPAQKNSAEESAIDAISTVLNDKTVFATNQRIAGRKSNYYQIYNSINKDGYMSNRHPVINVTLTPEGKLEAACFEDMNQEVNYYGMDYNMDKTGRIYKRKYSMNGQQVGRISQEDIKKLEEKLVEIVKTATPAY